MNPETRLIIEHHPRFTRATIWSPGEQLEFRAEGPPNIVYAALADYFRAWADGRRRAQP